MSVSDGRRRVYVGGFRRVEEDLREGIQRMVSVGVAKSGWAVFRGRGGFTVVCDTLVDHNLKVTRASGVWSHKFRYKSHAVDWLAEQVLEERAAAGLAAKEAAYAVEHARDLDREERLRYERREARRRMATEAEAAEDVARRDMR